MICLPMDYDVNIEADIVLWNVCVLIYINPGFGNQNLWCCLFFFLFFL